MTDFQAIYQYLKRYKPEKYREYVGDDEHGVAEYELVPLEIVLPLCFEDILPAIVPGALETEVSS